MTTAFWTAPETIMPRATASADTKLVHAASMSNAPALVAPRSFWTTQAVAGNT
jgi:hypothetical protein